ncbi:tyrosine-type recombinase/integrase [uncultured Sphingomonas sp.]|uniref:tyrosine-type recombinase/integrase n=1 Tax=uncultured Sphingomonas sp. TaxID=158754 RepID=UPI0035CBAF3E
MIKGVHFVRKRLADGSSRWYVYAWRGGPQVMSADGAKKPKLTQQAVEAISAELKTKDAALAPNPATLLSLVRTWRSEDPNRPSSPEWDRLAASTKKTWGSALNKIEEKWGNVPLNVFNDTRMIEKVIAWRDSRAATPRAADNGVTVLQALLKFGIQRGRLSINVAAGIGALYVNGGRAEIIWTDDNLKAFSKAAGEEDQHVDDAVQLAGATGMRREDLARLTWEAVGDFAIVKRAAKKSRGRRRFATMPRIPALDAVLDRLRDRPRADGVGTVLVNAKGKPWNLDTLSKEVARIAKKAGIVHVDDETGETKSKHLHDVRGTFATRLMTTTDLTGKEIASIMGWSEEEVERIRRIYVDDTARNVALGRRIARGV